MSLKEVNWPVLPFPEWWRFDRLY